MSRTMMEIVVANHEDAINSMREEIKELNANISTLDDRKKIDELLATAQQALRDLDAACVKPLEKAVCQALAECEKHAGGIAAVEARLLDFDGKLDQVQGKLDAVARVYKRQEEIEARLDNLLKREKLLNDTQDAVQRQGRQIEELARRLEAGPPTTEARPPVEVRRKLTSREETSLAATQLLTSATALCIAGNKLQVIDREAPPAPEPQPELAPAHEPQPEQATLALEPEQAPAEPEATLPQEDADYLLKLEAAAHLAAGDTPSPEELLDPTYDADVPEPREVLATRAVVVATGPDDTREVNKGCLVIGGGTATVEVRKVFDKSYRVCGAAYGEVARLLAISLADYLGNDAYKRAVSKQNAAALASLLDPRWKDGTKLDCITAVHLSSHNATGFQLMLQDHDVLEGAPEWLLGRAATLAPNVQRMTWLAHKGVIRSTGQHRWLVRCVMHNAQEATVYFVGPRLVTQAQAWQESIGALQLLRWVYTAAFKAREENAQEQPWVESLDAYGLAVRGLAESLVNAPRLNQSAKILRAVIVPHASKSKIEARDANGDTWRLELTGMPSQALLDSLPSVPVESDGKVWTLHYRQDTAYITGWPVAASQAMIDNLVALLPRLLSYEVEVPAL